MANAEANALRSIRRYEDPRQRARVDRTDPTLNSQERIEEHLQKNAGVAFCAACIAEHVGVSPTLGRAVVWMLLAIPAYQLVEHECASCRRVKRAIRFVAVNPSCAVAPRT